MNIQKYKDKVVRSGPGNETIKVLLGLEFQVHGSDAYIDSLQVARELGIGHNDFLKTIRKFIEIQVEIGNFGGMGKFTQTSNQPIKGVIETTYINNQNGQSYPLFLLNEKAALRIIMKSNSKNADRIQDIIAEGFLLLRDIVTITQSVVHPREESIMILKTELEAFALFDVPLHLAQIESVKTARNLTGIDHSDKLKLAPAQNNIPDEEIMLEPTELGKLLNITAIKMNKLLASVGLQAKINDQWIATDKAEGYYTRHSWTSGNKSGYNYKWNKAKVMDILDKVVSNYNNIEDCIKELCN